ncbi:histidine kinase [Streptomyces sp. NBC_01244]|uniref:histidine kinase n=1 Tax=Streptomyces sp. NBC_01244 TaxID=2903797 RepID=UPI002E0F301A|nr:histidine kinase [Streptomyces sp. NBC_01244]
MNRTTTDRADRAEARTAVLSERGRIARDVHDVLAHSLAGINMQLELTDALIDTGDLEKVREANAKAHALVKESLKQAQWTVHALIETTRRLCEQYPRVAVVVLTTFADDDSILGALGAGSRGYLTKKAGREDITRAIRAAAAGQSVLDREVQDRLLATVRNTATTTTAHAPVSGSALPEDLTRREHEVLARRPGARGQSAVPAVPAFQPVSRAFLRLRSVVAMFLRLLVAAIALLSHSAALRQLNGGRLPGL